MTGIWFLVLAVVLLLLSVAIFFRWRGRRTLPAPIKEAPPPAKEDLPPRYNTDEIIAMVKDPYWLHAYWEVTAAKQQEISQMFGPQVWEESRPVIRVYDVTDGEHGKGPKPPYVDMEIDEGATSWYLYLGRPDHTFYLDLGRLLPNGQFIRLARSNRVTLPSHAPSALIDPLWPPLEDLWAGQVVEWGRSTGASPVAWGIGSAQMPARRKK
jgi:hypothetical protein